MVKYLKKQNITQRNSNIELLRIICMFMIVISHYTVHNSVTNSSLPLGFNRLLLEVSNLGNMGVIIFILITGYYNIDKEHPFKLRKLILLIFQVFFYSSVIYLIFVILGLKSFSIKGFIENFFSIAFKRYWFMTAYMVLYIFMPFINSFQNNINRKRYTSFLIICLLVFSLLRMITTQDYYGNELIQFLLFYAIGGYLRKYKDNLFSKNYKLILISTSIILLLSVIIFDLLGTKITVFASHSTYLYSKHSIICILFSISLFELFLLKKRFYSKVINLFSKCVLGVYLISDNKLIRGILWEDILHVRNYIKSNILLFHMIGSVLLVFASCIIIELIRQKIIEKVLIKICDKVRYKIKNTVFFEKIYYLVNKV